MATLHPIGRHQTGWGRTFDGVVKDAPAAAAGFRLRRRRLVGGVLDNADDRASKGWLHGGDNAVQPAMRGESWHRPAMQGTIDAAVASTRTGAVRWSEKTGAYDEPLTRNC